MRDAKAARRGGALLGAAVAAIPGGAVAQEQLQGFVLGAGGGARPLSAGERLEAPPGRCVEVVFQDNTSVVLEPGADFTRQGIERDPTTGRLVLRGATTRGRVRVSTSYRTDVVLATPGAETRVVGGAALVQAGPGGSAALLDRGRVEVRDVGGRTEVIRRPNFELPFGSGGAQRQSQQALAQGLGAVAPVAQDQAQCRGPGGPVAGDPVVRVASNEQQPAARPVYQTRNEGREQARGGGGDFTLAAGGFGGPGAGGAGIGAPRVNSATAVVDGTNQIGTLGRQEPGLNIVGIESIQPQGPARVRRFAAAASGGLPGARSDTGVVAPPATALQAGQPVRGIASAYFQNLNATTLPVSQGQTFYDAIAQAGVVTLQVDNVFPRGSTPPQSSNDFTFDRISLPRYFVTDQNLPSITRSTPYTVRTFSGSEGDPLTSPSGLPVFTEPERNALLSPRTPVFVIGRAEFDGTVTIERLNADGTTTPERVPNKLPGPDGTADRNFTIAERQNFLASASAAVAGPVYIAEAFTPQDADGSRNALLVHRSGAVIELELQQRNPATAVPAPRSVGKTIFVDPPLTGASGQVFELSGGGLAMQVGGASLPGIAYVAEPTVGFGSGQVVRLTTLPDDNTSDQLTDTRPLRRPDVFILDKITAGNLAITQDRGILNGERFFVIAGTGITPPTDGSLPGGLDIGTVTRFAISDGLNPAGGFQPGLTIQDQFRGPGDTSQPIAFNRFNAFRPEETFIGYATPGTPRSDTHLLVIAGTADRNPAMRADLEVAADGRTSASVAAGGVLRLSAATLALSGNVVGATRVVGTDRGATAIIGNLGSLGTDATGVNDQLFGGNSRVPGQIGYFAVGESDTRLGVPGTAAGVQPGQLQDLGAATPNTGQFGFTRLAANVGPVGLGPSAPLALQGFASGLAEARDAGGAGAVFAASTTGLGGVTVTGRNGGREFDAVLRLSPTVAGDLPSAAPRRTAPVPAGERVVIIGDGGTGPVPTTAVASAATFAGVAPGRAAIASVDADLRRGITGHETPERGPLPPSNEHLTWGYFLGDLVNEANGRRENVALGFFVAGRPVDPGTLSTLTGTASYAGGMIGNVAEAGRVRTAVGDFNQNWDFGARRGNMAARFDGSAYNVPASMPAGSNVFAGSGVTGDRRMAVQGAFFNNGPVSGAPAAVGGSFGVAGTGYGANGIFVGRRQ
jgi:hypothetical protein